MKTKILVFFIAASLLVSFSFAQAQVTAPTQELQALADTIRQQIQDIREKIILLQVQIKEINPEYKPRFIPEFKSEFKVIKEEIKFTRNLRKGLRGQEVTDLQELLSKYPEIYPEGLVTGYFGALTERAVKKFQEKHSNDVLKPYGLNKGTGFVGKSTIAKLNQLTSQDRKVIICHYPPGNPDARHTIVISKSALEAHLATGSTVGACGDEPGQEPDSDPEPDTTAPADIADFTATVGDTKVELLWVNPDGDFEGVKIMRKVDTCPTGVTDADSTGVYDGDEESYTDDDLTNGTLYCYKAFAYDEALNYSAGVEASATPEPDTTAPADIADFTATVGDTKVELLWVNPDGDFEGVKIMRKVDAYPTGVTDGDEVYDDTGTTYTDTGLTNGTTYYYKAFTYDEVPNYSAGAEVNATPAE